MEKSSGVCPSPNQGSWRATSQIPSSRGGASVPPLRAAAHPRFLPALERLDVGHILCPAGRAFVGQQLDTPDDAHLDATEMAHLGASLGQAHEQVREVRGQRGVAHPMRSTGQVRRTCLGVAPCG